jgi:hypothetical protein
MSYLNIFGISVHESIQSKDLSSVISSNSHKLAEFLEISLANYFVEQYDLGHIQPHRTAAKLA